MDALVAGDAHLHNAGRGNLLLLQRGQNGPPELFLHPGRRWNLGLDINLVVQGQPPFRFPYYTKNNWIGQTYFLPSAEK